MKKLYAYIQKYRQSFTNRENPLEQSGLQAGQSMLSGYSEEQRAIILAENSVSQVIAAAGSGKTRTVIGYLNYRLENNLEKAGHILMLSFSRKACEELRERLAEKFRKSVEISTFHSFCFRHLIRLDPDLVGKNPGILEDDEIAEFYHQFFRDKRETVGGIPFSLMISRKDLFAIYFPDLYREVQQAFSEYKKRTGKMEYDDLIQRMLEALRWDMPFIRQLRYHYDLIIVDEFQDTDPDQLEFLQQMKPKRILVVGDDWQAIYAFRGATVQPFLNFKKIFPDVHLFYLSANFRSLGNIVSLGNRIIRSSSKQLKKDVVAARGKGPDFPVMAIHIEPGQEKQLAQLYNHLTVTEDMYPADIRILTRTNFRGNLFCSAGIPADSIMTIHKSKGLEFPVVFLDLAGGWHNALCERTEKLFDEEIRIAYVGLTRAQNFLVIIKRDYEFDEPEGYLYSLFARTVVESPVDRIESMILEEISYRKAR